LLKIKLSEDRNQEFPFKENKQVEVKENNISIGKYYYDGDGKRVKKDSTTETTIFLYDAGGKLVEEYSTKLSQEPQVAYLTSDSLGTPRINTGAGGAVIARHDYHPFGEEISTSQRTSGINYDSDEIRKTFTGYEHDEESDLDFAQARYYQKTHGRFTTTDPLLSSGNVSNPQTWNRFTYTLNNPVGIVDPTGMYVCDSSVSAGDCQQIENAYNRLTLVLGNMNPKSKAYARLKRALDALGLPGEANGVTIYTSSLQKESAAGWTATAGLKNANANRAHNPNQIDTRIIIDLEHINKDGGKDADDILALTLAHEGSHAADGEEWVASGFSRSKNPNGYRTETDAFLTEGGVARSIGYEGAISLTVSQKFANFDVPYKAKTYNPAWEGPDYAVYQANSIEKIVTTSKERGGYGHDPQSLKLAFSQNSFFKKGFPLDR
jgi:RHS repeat-associated protein